MLYYNHPYRLNPPEVGVAKLPQLWLPSQITTAAWYDASDKSTITETSGSVSQWNDKSGNSRHAIQGTGSLQPKTGIATISGLNAIDFDGIDDYLQHGTPLDFADGITIVSVYQAVTGRPFGVREVASGKKSFALGASDNSLRYDGAFSTGTIIPTGLPVIRVAYKNAAGTSQVDYVDGSLNINDTQILPDSTSVYINVGNCNNAFAQPSDGPVGECLVLSYAVDETTRQKIEGYLAHKWGLTANLPSGHPYKNNPPLKV